MKPPGLFAFQRPHKVQPLCMSAVSYRRSDASHAMATNITHAQTHTAGRRAEQQSESCSGLGEVSSSLLQLPSFNSLHFSFGKMFVHDTKLLGGEERWDYISYPRRYSNSSPAQTATLETSCIFVWESLTRVQRDQKGKT